MPKPLARSCARLSACLPLRPLLLSGLLAITSVSLPAQTSEKPADRNTDGRIVSDAPVILKTPTQLTDEAWTLLSEAIGDAKRPEVRSQALAALALMGSTPRSVRLIEQTMQDKDLDVRTASALAAGQTAAIAFGSPLRRLLDDKEPQVAYAAALALWKMGDRSGEDILMAVVDGERRASATLINGTEHDISKDLHSPSTLAKIGVMQVGGMFLGPFGYGITAYEYIKKNGGESARATAIEALSQEKTTPLKNEFIAALKDKDAAVKAAALKALDSYHQEDATKAIGEMMEDSKLPVRLTAAAAYLISSGVAQASPSPNARKAAATVRKH